MQYQFAIVAILYFSFKVNTIMKKLPIQFYKGADVILIAKELIGKVIVTDINGPITSGRIVETEAYIGFTDRLLILSVVNVQVAMSTCMPMRVPLMCIYVMKGEWEIGQRGEYYLTLSSCFSIFSNASAISFSNAGLLSALVCVAYHIITMAT